MAAGDMTGRLYLVRHGEAAGSDIADPDLSAAGQIQSEFIAQRLAHEDLGRILHSPTRRASRTAAVLGTFSPGAPVTATDVLDDRTPVPSAARRPDYPRRYWRWLDDTTEDERDPDGAELSRSGRTLADAARAVADVGALVAVTHAFVIGWLVREVVCAPTSAWLTLAPGYGSLTVIDYSDEGSRLIAFNDVGHLG